MIDLTMSHRGYNEFCRWWARDEREVFESNELVYKRTPSGVFWAKEESPETFRNNVVAGVVMFDSSNTMIKTSDDCSALKNNDLVEYQGELWICVSAQKVKAKKANTMYATDKFCSHFWYIELRK